MKIDQKLKAMLPAVIIILFCSFVPPNLRSTYNSALPGKAVLADERHISGKFYLHHDLFSKKSEFYYFARKHEKAQKYKVADIKEITLQDRKDTTRFVTFRNMGGVLVRVSGSHPLIPKRKFHGI